MSYFVLAATESESIELKKGSLCDKLRHTVDPGEISTLVEQLQQLEKGSRPSEVGGFILVPTLSDQTKGLKVLCHWVFYV